jgi:hypothetical protein
MEWASMMAGVVALYLYSLKLSHALSQEMVKNPL